MGTAVETPLSQNVHGPATFLKQNHATGMEMHEVFIAIALKLYKCCNHFDGGARLQLWYLSVPATPLLWKRTSYLLILGAQIKTPKHFARSRALPGLSIVIVIKFVSQRVKGKRNAHFTSN